MFLHQLFISFYLLLIKMKLLDLLLQDPAVTIPNEALESLFSVERFLANSAIVFERLEALEI